MAQVRLRFLGCGDAFSSGGRLQACLQLEGGGEPLLIDCGATALVSLKRERIDPASVGYVVLSHLHGDHFAGVPWLILDGQFAGRERPLVIAGPAETEERLRLASEALYPGTMSGERGFAIRIVEVQDRVPADLGPAVVTPFAVAHSSGAPSHALRVQYGGKVIAYSGDTEWTDTLIEVARGADLFVCECNFYDKKVPGHLDFKTLSAQLPRLQCERLVITHMSDQMLARVAEIDVQAASDGLVVEL
jgi:ribonuclease BN (tRNA processing enzyme)